MRFLRKQRGFTLIELLVVVAILGVLALVAMPNVLRFMDSGKVEAANAEAHSVVVALTAYMYDNGVAPETSADLTNYFINMDELKGTYTFADDGSIEDAEWEDATLNWVNGQWVKT